MNLVPRNGGGLHECLQSDVILAMDSRLDHCETQQGEIVRDIAGTRQIANRVLEEILVVKGQFEKAEGRRDEELRKIDRRVERLEDEDSLSAGSAVTYSHEALARKYESLKSDITALKVERDAANMAKDIAASERAIAEKDRVDLARKHQAEATERAAVEAALLLAQAKARKVVLAGYASGVVVVLGALAAAVVQILTAGG
jgi:hypothetical protein